MSEQETMGKMKRDGPGRPKLPPGKRRTKFFKIRVTPAEVARLKKRIPTPTSTKIRKALAK